MAAAALLTLMLRWGLAALLTGWLAVPWTGCELQPVTPPAMPPAERAPTPVESPDDGGVLFLPVNRRLV